MAHFRGDSVAVSPLVGYAVDGDALAAFWAAMGRSPPNRIKAMCVLLAAKWACNDDIGAGYPALNRGCVGSLCHDEDRPIR